MLTPMRAPTGDEPAGINWGTKLKNMIIRDWEPEVGCESPIFDISITQLRRPAWDAYQLFENMIYDGSNPLFGSACAYESGYASDTSIEVVGDANTLYGGSGFLVGSLHVPLIGTSTGCNDVGGCLHFCPGACLRSIRFYTSNTVDVWNYKMKVSDGTNTITVDRFSPDFFGNNLEERYFEYSSYSVSLPAGNFDVWFEDENEPGVMVYPKFVTPVFEIEPSCSGFVTEASITILKPPAEDLRCDELIHNGDFTLNIEGWQEWEAKIFYGETAGILGTGALVTNRVNHATIVTQWLDHSCIMGNPGVYLFEAFYRTVDQTDDLTTAQDLPDVDGRPFFNIMFAGWNEEKQKFRYLDASYPNQNYVPPTPAPTQAPTKSPTSGSQFQTVKLHHLEDVTPLKSCQGNCQTDADCQVSQMLMLSDLLLIFLLPELFSRQFHNSFDVGRPCMFRKRSLGACAWM